MINIFEAHITEMIEKLGTENGLVKRYIKAYNEHRYNVCYAIYNIFDKKYRKNL